MEDRKKTYLAHHHSCPYEYAWDVAGEMYATCNCPIFWPRRVCTECGMSPKRHRKECSQRPRDEAKEA